MRFLILYALTLLLNVSCLIGADQAAEVAVVAQEVAPEQRLKTAQEKQREMKSYIKSIDEYTRYFYSQRLGKICLKLLGNEKVYTDAFNAIANLTGIAVPMAIGGSSLAPAQIAKNSAEIKRFYLFTKALATAFFKIGILSSDFIWKNPVRKSVLGFEKNEYLAKYGLTPAQALKLRAEVFAKVLYYFYTEKCSGDSVIGQWTALEAKIKSNDVANNDNWSHEVAGFVYKTQGAVTAAGIKELSDKQISQIILTANTMPEEWKLQPSLLHKLGRAFYTTDQAWWIKVVSSAVPFSRAVVDAYLYFLSFKDDENPAYDATKLLDLNVYLKNSLLTRTAPLVNSVAQCLKSLITYEVSYFLKNVAEIDKQLFAARFNQGAQIAPAFEERRSSYDVIYELLEKFVNAYNNIYDVAEGKEWVTTTAGLNLDQQFFDAGRFNLGRYMDAQH